MRKYWVLWTYIANYSGLLSCEAESPKEAIKRTTGCFSEDFHKKATIFVFDHPPVFTKEKGTTTIF